MTLAVYSFEERQDVMTDVVLPWVRQPSWNLLYCLTFCACVLEPVGLLYVQKIFQISVARVLQYDITRQDHHLDKAHGIPYNHILSMQTVVHHYLIVV